MGWESSDVVQFELGPLLQGQMRITKIKSAYTSLIIGPRHLGWEIMCSESSDVAQFGLVPLLQGQMRIAKLKSALTRLLLVQEV